MSLEEMSLEEMTEYSNLHNQTALSGGTQRRSS